jgi:hypothetical protein
MNQPSPSTSRQQLLQLWLHGPSLDSGVVAWSLYDGTSTTTADDDLPGTPPYGSALAAMRDGWRVVGIAPARVSTPGHEFRTSFLPHEIVLERLLEPAHV